MTLAAEWIAKRQNFMPIINTKLQTVVYSSDLCFQKSTQAASVVLLTGPSLFADDRILSLYWSSDDKKCHIVQLAPILSAGLIFYNVSQTCPVFRLL